MITGIITQELRPILDKVFLRGKDGSLIPVVTMLDTGFNCAFAFPRRLLNSLQIQPIGKEVFRLADGTEIDEQVYAGEVIVDNQPYFVEMIATDLDTGLMGMEMLLEKEAIFNLKTMTIKVV
jgi:predicted aspartyl protease